ncbi:transglutaminase-like cysteine peptidase [Pseudoalteromonas sp. MMG010]|uniref:transglutaminase-like cysteine peptidase n=1 Tax=Pseudoalteromonas sp. MMG010 TaxID=2822685 RepID=UPI001B3A6E9A|nr:transglutaminase-like cysteine peptidase [Pseudoalteromonas sp. MMG010]MBQ4834149.1 transglutaminase-like cysteine peptidase [Pseudoalteromonas sp. MMG010]
MKGGLLILLILTCCVVAKNDITLKLLSVEVLKKINQQYSSDSVKRTKGWLAFLKKSELSSEWQKLHLVNDFFNKNITYRSDLTLWKKNDYWATPIETLAQGAGDCEDYAIAKYFSLLALGVAPVKLRLMYVRQLEINEPHMVLIYFSEPNTVPYVLDNYKTALLPANKRKDLKPIYSFNAQGLWLAKAKGLGVKINTKNKGFSHWNLMLNRIETLQVNRN